MKITALYIEISRSLTQRGFMLCDLHESLQKYLSYTRVLQAYLSYTRVLQEYLTNMAVCGNTLIAWQSSGVPHLHEGLTFKFNHQR
jgi:hypothetical protein